MILNFGLLLATLLILGVVESRFWHGPWTAVRVLEADLMIAGLLMGSIARLQLGNAFSIRARAQRLVTTGMYRRIRNPVYVFGGLGIGGLFLFDGVPWALILLVAVALVQVVRSRNEATVLRQAFGREYERYRAQTWF